MFHSDSYKHLEGRPYILGLQDCYGLLIDFYWELFGIKLTNYARPEYAREEVLSDNLYKDGWDKLEINWRQLQFGDGITFSVMGDRSNHLGVYVGNGYFLHHMADTYSRTDSLYPKWLERATGYYRHPKTTEILKALRQKAPLETIIPEHIKRYLKND